MTFVWRYAIRSEVGLVRAMNEDAGYAGQHLIAVADGMGGHAAGEVASAATIAALTSLDLGAADDIELEMRRAVETANTTLREIVAADSELHGMGTTVTAAMIEGSSFVLVHVGDSRAYLLRDGTLRQLTRDHTFVQQLVDDGQLRAEEVSAHPQRSVITRALDGRKNLDVDVEREDLRPGDRYLLCSDGLSGVVTDETMTRALSAGTPDDAVDSLVALALRAGGPDNITCVVADVAEVDDVLPANGQVAGSADDTGVVARSKVPAGAAAIAVEAPPRAAQRGAAPPRDEPLALDDPRVRSRSLRRRRTVALVVTSVALLGLGALIGWRVVQSQYFVSVAGDDVTIFRGVQGSVLGLDLNSAHEPTDLLVTDLPDFAQSEVRDGIPAEDLADARTIVDRLRNSTTDLPLGTTACPQLPAQSPTPAPARGPQVAPTCSPDSIPLASPSPSIVPASPS